MGKDSPQEHLIKRYANRKLYDTELRRFTTLDEVARLIDSGLRVVVTDHDTGEDRTNDVLAQMIGRRIRSGSGGSALNDLLRTSSDSVVSVAGGLLGPLVEPPKPKKAKAGAKGDGKAKGKAGGKAKAEAGKKPKKAKPVESDASGEGDASAEELRELRQQVSDLTAAVQALLNKDATSDGR